MGDRANIKVKSSDGEIYFYTHWAGTELPQTLQSAIRRGKSRWKDESYLNRIIFSEMVRGDISGETGYGISIGLGGGDNRIITVEHDNQLIEFKGDRYTFEEYIALEKPQF